MYEFGGIEIVLVFLAKGNTDGILKFKYMVKMDSIKSSIVYDEKKIYSTAKCHGVASIQRPVSNNAIKSIWAFRNENINDRKPNVQLNDHN